MASWFKIGRVAPDKSIVIEFFTKPIPKSEIPGGKMPERGPTKSVRTAGVLLCLLSVSATAGPGDPLSLEDTLWEQAAKPYGIDPYTLYAVALLESARPGHSGIRPWPWTLRTPGGPIYADTRQEARQALRSALERYESRNVDVGLMQINVRWHAHRAAPVKLLDPAINLKVAAQILAQAIRSVPDRPVLGLGRYHSWKTPRALRYGRRVARIRDALRSLSQPRAIKTGVWGGQ